MLLEEKRDRLLGALRGFGSCAVAFSGGVDSAVVAKAAQLALGNQAVAVTGVSASLAAGELEAAKHLADLIGIRHEILQTDEFAEANYVANPANRCYFCKTELYQQIEPLAARLHFSGHRQRRQFGRRRRLASGNVGGHGTPGSQSVG